jgi:hypothetical protein
MAEFCIFYFRFILNPYLHSRPRFTTDYGRGKFKNIALGDAERILHRSDLRKLAKLLGQKFLFMNIL